MFVYYLTLAISALHVCHCVDLTYYVKEGKNPGTYIGDIASDTHLLDSVRPYVDRDLIRFTHLQQDLTGSSQLFRVAKKTGKLYTAQTLDAESLCAHGVECLRMLDVAVRKGASFITLLEIKVVIQDINDHQPEFPNKQINIKFSELDVIGTKRKIPNAKDRDVGTVNSQISYQMKKKINEPFSLSMSQNVAGTSDLGITLEERLDREVKDSYQIQVIAKDGGSPPKQDILDVFISVIDVNDNIPVFSQKVYNVSIGNDHNKNSPIIILSAKDSDSGNNGKILYHFSSETSDVSTSMFDLNEDTGEVYLRKTLTLGQTLTYKLYIKATDQGNPSLSSLAKVSVNVISQQNNPPIIDVNFVFKLTQNMVTISEDIEVGSFIAYVKVTDHDAGHNGEVSCDLHHDKFQLQNLSTKKYKVVVKNLLDRETEDHHELTINCQDRGSPPLHSESKFSIKVKDINDVQPQFFKETYTFRIYENQRSNFPVGFINATDPDQGSGGQLTYSLLTDNKHFLPFQIRDDGFISTIMSLDHEFKYIYKFQVLVKDKGTPSLNNTVNVVVEIRDQNDNTPYFTFPSINPFMMNILYYPHYTKKITVLKASDSDSRENAFLKYEITSGNDKQLFTVNHYTGSLSFTRVVTQQDAGSYDLEFVVKDSGSPVRSATTAMTLSLTVSNKTSEMSNTVHVKTEDKIHLNLAVVIVLVAVSVSVITTAFISICIIRCNERQNARQKEEANSFHRCVSEQRHLMCPSYHGDSWMDAPVTIATDADKAKDAHLRAARTESHSADDSTEGLKNLPASLNPWRSIEKLRQMQEVVVLPSNEKSGKNTIMTPDYFSWRSPKSSHSDSSHNFNVGDAGHREEIPGVYTYQYSVPPPSQSDQPQKSDTRRHLGQTPNKKSSATTGQTPNKKSSSTTGQMPHRKNSPITVAVDRRDATKAIPVTYSKDQTKPAKIESVSHPDVHHKSSNVLVSGLNELNIRPLPPVPWVHE